MTVWRITYPLGKKSDPHGSIEKKHDYARTMYAKGASASHKVDNKDDIDHFKRHFAKEGFYNKGERLKVEKFKGTALRGKPISTTYITSNPKKKVPPKKRRISYQRKSKVKSNDPFNIAW